MFVWSGHTLHVSLLVYTTQLCDLLPSRRPPAAVVFGFNCHANVVSVFYELEHYPDKIISRLPAR
jgi:hypothetical protein